MKHTLHHWVPRGCLANRQKMTSQINSNELREFAKTWVNRIEGNESTNEKVEDTAVLISIVRPAEYQWQFILHAIHSAVEDVALAAIGKGPLQHLLRRHAGSYTRRVLTITENTPNLTRSLTAVNQELVPTELREEVRLVCDKVEPIATELVRKAAIKRIRLERELLRKLKAQQDAIARCDEKT